MYLDENYKIEEDGTTVVLIKTTPITNKEGGKSQRVDKYYYPNTLMAMRAYIQKSVTPSLEVKDVVEEVNKSLNKVQECFNK